MKKRIIAGRILLSIIFLMIVMFVSIHYDSKEYSADNEQAYVSRICEMTGIPSMSVAIMDEDAEIFLNYSKDDTVVVNEKSLYELASATKAFTALAVLQLEQEGRLKLTDPVNQYIPWFEPEFEGVAAAITISQLLEHTSGIPPWTICLIPAGTREDSSLQQTIEKIKNIALANEPGKVHAYATINYDVLALVIEQITGQRFEDYMKENVLEPLGMEDSFFRIDNFSDGIILGNKVDFLKTRPFDAPAYYGNTAAGYLVSNASDLIKWMKSVNRLFDFDGAGVNTDDYYAGWHVYDDYVCHSGNNPNYCSQVIISRNGKVGVFALSALSGSSATKAAEDIYRIHLGESVKIGLYIDNAVLLDFASITAVLVLVYLILLIQVNSKKKAVFSLFFGSIFSAGIVLFPFVSHYSYNFLSVWCPKSLLLFILAGACFSIIQIYSGIVWLKNCKAKG